MIQPFVYNALPGRVIFGSGTIARVPDEVRLLGCSRALVLSGAHSKGRARELAARLGGLCAGTFTEAVMHTPVEVTERAMEAVRVARADCTVAVGGGSAIGLGKAIALRTDLPQIVIPTTYSGSEVSAMQGETKDGQKTTQRSLKILPEVVIYDVDLTLSLPPALSATSGMNAIAHAVEALYAREGNPITSLMAEQGIAALARALPRILRDPNDKDARADALYGAWACGTCLSVGMALHHKLAHVLGGSFGLPHSETHTVLLPHAAAYNQSAAAPAMARVAGALGVPSAPQGLFDLAASLGAPTSLRQLGMPEQGLDRAVELVLAAPYWNPRELERTPLRALLEDAYHGRRPRGPQ